MVAMTMQLRLGILKRCGSHQDYAQKKKLWPPSRRGLLVMSLNIAHLGAPTEQALCFMFNG